MKISIDLWRKDGKHLPEFMRDFHDQKDLFKAMHETTVWPDNEISGITWVQSHILIIDVFLWFMARHGYTLQKTRTRLTDADDIEQTMLACRKHRANVFASMLKRAEG